MPRQSKTPAQRAQEQLDLSVRVVARLTRKAGDLRAQLQDVEAELADATARRDFLAGHPDLKKPTTTLKENPSR